MKERDSDALERLVRTALEQEHRSGVSEMLRVIAESVEADACILWQESPFSYLDADPPEGHLFVLADWYRSEPDRKVPRCTVHDLPLSSRTGEAVLEQRPCRVDDITEDARVVSKDTWLREAGVRSFCGAPLRLGGKRGAVNAYRFRPVPFSAEELDRLVLLTGLLPRLYETVTDKLSYRLVRSIQGTLSAVATPSQKGGNPASSTGEHFRDCAASLCREMSQAFDALEVSLFLEDPSEHQGSVRLYGTTWPAKEGLSTTEYHSKASEGLTGWVLENGQPLRIFNLAAFGADEQLLLQHYAGLQWHNAHSIESDARMRLALEPTSPLPPLSFIAAPVRVGNRVVGALRCSIARNGPYLFSDAELTLLQLAANQIGQAWHEHLAQSRIERENSSWWLLVQSIQNLNREAQQQLANRVPDQMKFLSLAARNLPAIIDPRTIAVVRLLDPAHRELRLATASRSIELTVSSPDVSPHPPHRFPVATHPNPTAGARASQTGETVEVTPSTPAEHRLEELFPGYQQRIVAPIGEQHEIVGVLDLLAPSHSTLPMQARSVAALIGQQLGLYLSLLRHVKSLQSREADQARSFEDFAHQIKSPIFQAYRRIQSLVNWHDSGLPDAPDLQQQIQALRGLMGRAKRASERLQFFANFAQGKDLVTNPRPLDQSELFRDIMELAADQQAAMDPRRNVRFEVEPSGFSVLNEIRISADQNLVLQAIGNLLDNAAKYSHDETNVTISAGLTSMDKFFISVKNVGLPFTASDIQNRRTRGWRGARAKEVTGEGTGIGLWIVENIMVYHGGELQLTPSLPSESTEVRLVFRRRD